MAESNYWRNPDTSTDVMSSATKPLTIQNTQYEVDYLYK